MSDNEERARALTSFLCSFNAVANQADTHAATLLPESAALGCKKAAAWQRTKASRLRATEMKEDGKEVKRSPC